MSFRWEAYLDLAQHLATGPVALPVPKAEGAEAPPEGEAGEQAKPPAAPPDPSEAALRTAVSRAYYSAYHLAREYVVRNNLGSVGKLESHQDVWRALGVAGGKPRPRQETRIRTEGGILHQMRKNADYEIDPPSWPRRPATPEARQRQWKEEANLAVARAGTIRDLLVQLQTRN